MPTTILYGETYEEALHRRCAEEAAFQPMQKHTLGPWNCNKASAGGREIIVSEVSPVDVAVLSHRDKTQAEINANARLIAAAPEMYEALKLLTELFDKHDDCSALDKTVEARRASRAAIAKEVQS